MNRFHWQSALPWLFLIGTLLLFWPSSEVDYVSDDRPLLSENSKLDRSDAVSRFFSDSLWANANVEQNAGRIYRPLTLVWFKTLHHLADSAWVHRLLVLLLHLAVAVMFLLLLRKLLPSLTTFQQSIGVVLFAAHPVVVEPVAWIVGSSEPLMALFGLVSVYGWIRFREQNHRGWFAVSLLALVLAMLSKETAIILLPLMVVWDVLRQGSLRAVWKAWISPVLIVGFYLIIRAAVLDRSSMGSDFSFTIDNGRRWLEFLTLSFRYLFVPWPQPFYLRYPAEGLIQAWEWITGVTVLLSMIVTAWRFPPLRWPLMWIVLTLMPPLALAFHVEANFALRFLYLPAVGFVLYLMALWRQLPPMMLPISVYAVVLASMIPVAVSGWNNERTLYERTIIGNPNDYGGYIGLARYWSERGDATRVEAIYLHALQNPALVQRAAIMESLALHFAEQKRYEESLNLYRRMLPLAARKAPAWVGVGNNLWMLQRLSEAKQAYERALQANPQHADALFNFAAISEVMGDKQDAIMGYQRFLQIRSNNADATVQRVRRALQRLQQD